MDCLDEHYESPFEDSSSDEMTIRNPKEPTHRDQETQTIKKTNKDAEI